MIKTVVVIKLKIWKFRPSGIAFTTQSFTLTWDHQAKDDGIWS